MHLREQRGLCTRSGTGARTLATRTLIVAVCSARAATQLYNYFHMTIRRALATTNATTHGVPIAAVEFIPRDQGP